MTLRVGGSLFDKKDISINDLRRWDCPSLLIDYVRYYQWVNESKPEEQVIEEDNPSKDSICKALESSTKKFTTKQHQNIERYFHF